MYWVIKSLCIYAPLSKDYSKEDSRSVSGMSGWDGNGMVSGSRGDVFKSALYGDI